MSSHPSEAEDLEEQICRRCLYREMLESLERRVDPEEYIAGDDGMFTAQDYAFLREQGIALPA